MSHDTTWEYIHELASSSYFNAQYLSAAGTVLADPCKYLTPKSEISRMHNARL